MFETDELKRLEVDNIGTDVMEVGAGEFEVVGIRHRSEGSNRTTTLWCAPALGFLPVVIEQQRDGKRQMRASLERYQLFGT